MRVAFRRATSLIYDRIIARATGGEYVHCEVEVPDGRWFSSNAPEGVRFIHLVPGDPLWRIITVPWEFTPDLVTWCNAEVGKPYDYEGAIASGLGLDKEDSGSWFCSEIVAAVLLRAGAIDIPPLMPPSGCKHRGGLYEWLQANPSLRSYQQETLLEQWNP